MNRNKTSLKTNKILNPSSISSLPTNKANKRKSHQESINLIDKLIDDQNNTGAVEENDLIDEFDHEKANRINLSSLSKRVKLLNCAINVNDDDSDINLLDCTEISEETNKDKDEIQICLDYKLVKREEIDIELIDSCLQEKVMNPLLITRPKSILKKPKTSYLNKTVNTSMTYCKSSWFKSSDSKKMMFEEVENELIDNLSLDNEAPTTNINLQKGTDWLNNLNDELLIKNLITNQQQQQNPQTNLLFHSQKNPKFSKNGFASQLKSLIEREKSAINFNNYLLKKDRLPKNNIIKISSCKKEIFYNLIFLIHGRDLEKNEPITILFSKASLDSNAFERITSKSLIYLYPPWRRASLIIENQPINAYFCVNLYKIVENDCSNVTYHEESRNIKFSGLKCNLCSFDTTECKNYFDYKQLFAFDNKELKNTQIELFCSEFNGIQSQEINFNKSILDSLEENGYCGNVSFQAVVQRVYRKEFETNQLKNYILVTDKYNIIAQIQIPSDFKIKESFKYDFKYLKLIKKQITDSSLDKQIEYLWKHLSKSKETNKANHPKISYLFEFLTNQSKIEEKEKSKAYVELVKIKDFDDILQLRSENRINRYSIEFVGILLLTASYVEADDENCKKDHIYELYVADKKRNILKFQIKHLNILNSDIIKMLSENYIVKGFISNFSDSLVLDEYSSVEFSSLIDSLSYLKNSIDLVEQKNLKTKSFVAIFGTVVNILEDQCFTILKCSNCNSINDLNRKDSDWFCNACQKPCKNPEVKLTTQLVLSCEKIFQSVKLRPHFETIKNLLKINKNEINLEKMLFEASSLINQKIGPIFAFIYKINDSDVFCKEISINNVD